MDQAREGRDAPVVLVLASGRGERFVASGGSGSKLDAPLGQRSVLEHTLAAVRESGLPWRVERASHAGMGDCIAAAVRATRAAAGWLILPGDLPLVGPATLRAVALALVDGGAVVPVHAGRRGHPVGFGRENGDALASLAGPQGAASVIKSLEARGRVRLLPVDDAGAVTDIDTVDDLAAAASLLARRAAVPPQSRD